MSSGKRRASSCKQNPGTRKVSDLHIETGKGEGRELTQGLRTECPAQSPPLKSTYVSSQRSINLVPLRATMTALHKPCKVRVERQVCQFA